MTEKKTETEYTPDELAEIDRIVKIVTGETQVLPARDIKPSTRSQPSVEKTPDDSAEEEPFEESMPEYDDSIHEKKPEELGLDELDHDTDLFPPEAEEIKEHEFEDITESIKEPSEILPGDEEEILPLSDSDISFIEDDEIPAVTSDESFEDIGDLPEIPEETPSLEDEQPRDISIESDEDLDIPDFNEISIDEHADLSEAADLDIPDIDIDSLVSDGTTETPPADIPADEDSGEDLEFPDIDAGEEKAPSETKSTLDEFDDFQQDEILDIETPVDRADKGAPADSSGFDEFADIESTEITHDFAEQKPAEAKFGDDDTLTIEPLEDEFDSEPAPLKPDVQTSESEKGSSLEITDRDLAKLKKAMILFNPAVRQTIRDVIINDLLSLADTRKLVDMIVSGKSEDSVKSFLEKKLKTHITLIDETGLKRRVISQRPEYTIKGRERQKKLLKFTKIFGISAAAAFLVTILSYQFIYKPVMAKRLINRGVELIISSGLEGNRFDRKGRYQEAEKLFLEVEREYAKDYLYGYNAYARAYFKNKDYAESLQKLNGAYNINRTNIDTLNNLGYFYARIDKNYYSSLKPSVPQWYFGGKKDPAQEANLDLAINFYRRALLVDDENITALVGIGNAYFMQGQYLKARQYYLNILKVDPNSVAGYSGLLNLYIERDSFPLTATLHAEIRGKGMLSDLPSPLLAKLAGFYLDKRRKGDSSVRIDYGVTTPRLKDADDNTYPAVLEVLKALNKKDPDYPPLHIQYARYHQALENYTAMKRYLDKALGLSPKYFAALHLMGEYYYNTNDPVNAYRFLKGATDNYSLQPGFTEDDFYRETESIGKSYFYLANIFYYYFDKIKTREGALDDEMPDNEREKMENYTTAQSYYEKAYNNNFNSPELNYNLGRVYYLKGQNTFALERWLQLYDDFIQSPELMLSLGNAFYKNGNYDAAKGEFLKMIYVMEYEADKSSSLDFSKKGNVKLFQSLSTGYNNLGAVYQQLGEYDKRDLAYWKAIEYSQRMGKESEYGRTNLAKSHRNAEPILDDSIPFSIAYYMEDWRR
jgi:tetratricopeptide (TPR) repeat protein